MPNTVAQKYAPWLWTLLALFFARVVAQLGTLVVDIPGLPAFDAWHSSVIPYPTLVAAQFIIIAIFSWTALTFRRGIVVPRRRLGAILLIFASLYAVGMLGRLLLGLTVLSDHSWFNHYLPTLFHLVLATFIGIVGHFHFQYKTRQE